MLQDQVGRINADTQGLLALASGADEELLQTIRDRIKGNREKKAIIQEEIESLAESHEMEDHQTVDLEWLSNYKEAAKEMVKVMGRATEEDKAIVCRTLIKKIILTGEDVEIQVLVRMDD